MHGSAAVIGLQMLPVLGTVVPRAEAEPHAAALGVAFQLTNFLRDVGEDLDRGRVYLPADELAAFGVDRELLVLVPAHPPAPTRGCARALAHLVAHTRGGLPPRRARASPCWSRSRGPAWAARSGSTAASSTRSSAADYDVLHRRVAVSTARAGAAGRGARAWCAAMGPARSAGAAQNAIACARRLTSRCRPARSDAIGVPGSESSSANSQRRMSGSE